MIPSASTYMRKSRVSGENISANFFAKKAITATQVLCMRVHKRFWGLRSSLYTHYTHLQALKLFAEVLELSHTEVSTGPTVRPQKVDSWASGLIYRGPSVQLLGARPIVQGQFAKYPSIVRKKRDPRNPVPNFFSRQNSEKYSENFVF